MKYEQKQGKNNAGKDFEIICSHCDKRITTKRENQKFCNKECYAKSHQLKESAKNSLLIKYNSVAKWRQGTNGKKFTNATTFKKGDERLMGANNPRWNRDKDFMKLCRQIRGSIKYLIWKRSILERDKEDAKNLQVHHIKPFVDILIENKICSVDEANECQELWETNNGITITKGEHQIISQLERMRNNTKGFIRLLADFVEVKC